MHDALCFRFTFDDSSKDAIDSTGNVSIGTTSILKIPSSQTLTIKDNVATLTYSNAGGLCLIFGVKTLTLMVRDALRILDQLELRAWSGTRIVHQLTGLQDSDGNDWNKVSNGRCFHLKVQIQRHKLCIKSASAEILMVEINELGNYAL